MRKELTRRELYDLVWARPVTKVATDLGVSDVALNKICKNHRVPTPGRGYWAKVAAGKPVKQALFHEVQDPHLDRILIQGSPLQSLPRRVAEARRQAIAKTKTWSDERPAQEPSGFYNGHPLVEGFRQKIEKAKPNQEGFIHVSGNRLFSVSVSPASVDRTLSILNRLSTRAEQSGYRFVLGDGGLYLNVDGEPISLHMSEKTDKVPHQPIEAELTALRRWEADRERKRRREEWFSDWDKPRIPEWDHVPNGMLVLEIDRGNHWDGLRRKFSDGKRQRLETMIDVVLIGAATCSAVIKAKREDAERRKREWEEAEKRRREAKRRRTLEAKRWEFLERQIELQEQARRIDTFIENYSSRHPEQNLPNSCQELIRWARNRSESIRKTIAPASLAETLDHHSLMDDSTELETWVQFK